MATQNRTPTYVECFTSLGLGLAPFFLLAGISALFGANTVRFDGQAIHGIAALLFAILVNVLFAAICAGFQKLGYVILGLLRRKRSKEQT